MNRGSRHRALMGDIPSLVQAERDVDGVGRLDRRGVVGRHLRVRVPASLIIGGQQMSNSGYESLIEALTIMAKYDDDSHPVAAEHDVIYAGVGINLGDVSQEDLKRLEELGWTHDKEFDCLSKFV